MRRSQKSLLYNPILGNVFSVNLLKKNPAKAINIIRLIIITHISSIYVLMNK